MMRQFIKYTVEKKTAIDGTLSVVGFFFLSRHSSGSVSKLNMCVLQQQETVCEGFIRYRYELHPHGPVWILQTHYMPNWHITWKN